MHCIITLEEMTRNLLMLAGWLPSLAIAAAVFFKVLQQQKSRERSGTLLALAAGALTLFTCWGGIMLMGALLIC